MWYVIGADGSPVGNKRIWLLFWAVCQFLGLVVGYSAMWLLGY
jgi:hypothetical protein